MSPTPFLEFRRGRYYAAVAFVYGRQDCDWLAAIYRELPSGRWRFMHRVRVYVDGKVLGSNDPRTHFESELERDDATDDEAIQVLRNAGETMIAAGFNDTIDLIVLRTDDPRVCARELMIRPWAHLQKGPKVIP